MLSLTILRTSISSPKQMKTYPTKHENLVKSKKNSEDNFYEFFCMTGFDEYNWQLKYNVSIGILLQYISMRVLKLKLNNETYAQSILDIKVYNTMLRFYNKGIFLIS